jgi:hypothetical protein
MTRGYIAMDITAVPGLIRALGAVPDRAGEAAARIHALLAEGELMGPHPSWLHRVSTWAGDAARDVNGRLAVLTQHIPMGPYPIGTWVAGRQFDDCDDALVGYEDGRRLVELLSADQIDEEALDQLLAEIGMAQHDPNYMLALLTTVSEGLDLDEESRLELGAALAVAGAVTRTVSGARETVLRMESAATEIRSARNAALRSGNPAVRAEARGAAPARLPGPLASLARNPLVRRAGPVLMVGGAVVGTIDDIDGGMSTTDALIRNGSATMGAAGGGAAGGLACGALAKVTFGAGAASCVVLVPGGAYVGEKGGRLLGDGIVWLKDSLLGWRD